MMQQSGETDEHYMVRKNDYIAKQSAKESNHWDKRRIKLGVTKRNTKSGLFSTKPQEGETNETALARVRAHTVAQTKQRRKLETQEAKVARLEGGKIIRAEYLKKLQTAVRKWLEDKAADYAPGITRIQAMATITGRFFVHICCAYLLRNALPQYYNANGKQLTGILNDDKMIPSTRKPATNQGRFRKPIIANWARGQSKIAEGIRHCKLHHKRTLRLAPCTNKLAIIWIPCRDPRASSFKAFNKFGGAHDELWFSEEEISVKGLVIDIFDAGDSDDDNSVEEHDSDPSNSDDDEYDRALTVIERVAIANGTNDDEAGSMETVVDAEVVDAEVVDAEVVSAEVVDVEVIDLRSSSDDES